MSMTRPTPADLSTATSRSVVRAPCPTVNSVTALVYRTAVRCLEPHLQLPAPDGTVFRVVAGAPSGHSPRDDCAATAKLSPRIEARSTHARWTKVPGTDHSELSRSAVSSGCS